MIQARSCLFRVIIMNRTSKVLSEEGEVVALSDFTQVLIGKQVISIKQRDLYQSKLVTLKYEEVVDLYEILKGVMEDE